MILTRCFVIGLVVLCLSFAARAQRTTIEASGFYVTYSFGSTQVGAGEVVLVNTRGFAAAVEYFHSPRLSFAATAMFAQPEVFLLTSISPRQEIDLDVVDVNSVRLTGRFAFLQRSSFSLWAGAGAALLAPGNFEDRFGDAIDVRVSGEVAPVFETGLRVPVRPRVTALVTFAYIPIDAELTIERSDQALPQHLDMSHLSTSFGLSWRF